MFGVFTNDHNTDPVTQTAQIYTGLNALYNAYVGSETLPTGTNPFVPAPTPTPDEKSNAWIWITVLSVVCAILLGGLGFAIYKWKAAQKNTEINEDVRIKQPMMNPSNTSEDL